MSFDTLCPLANVLLCAALAAWVLRTDRRSPSHRFFALGMAVLILREVATLLAARADLPWDVIRWQRVRLVAASLLPFAWFLFSLTYARADQRVTLRRWRWLAAGLLVFPLALNLLFSEDVFQGALSLDSASRWLLPLGRAGQALNVFQMVGSLLVLANLELTFRASAGLQRWRVKLLVVGLFVVFAAQVYVCSQNLLVYYFETLLVAVSSGALAAANVLIVLSLRRSSRLDLDIVLPPAGRRSSVAVLLIALYLLGLGVLPGLLRALGRTESISLRTLPLLLAALLLVLALLSDLLRQHGRRLAAGLLGLPAHDYRQVWTDFTRRATALVDSRKLSAVTAQLLAETFGVPTATVWLTDESEERLVLGGSTRFGETEAARLLARPAEHAALIRWLKERGGPRDLGAGEELPAAGRAWAAAVGARYAVPLSTGRSFLGIVTLGERLTGGSLTREDLELLKTIADQAAASLLHQRLSERLLRAKEMEAFQSLSAFFVHDLKNLASTLSMTMQNLPQHFHDPAFREDMLRVMQKSVGKIDDMCSRLSPLSRRLELGLQEASLERVVEAALEQIDGAQRQGVTCDLRALPPLHLDPEQVQKVVVNLLLNAHEAIAARREGGPGAPAGAIQVRTEQCGEWACLSVSDNGSGMSDEFMASSLFQPFQTTKRLGLGIGLYHSRKIIEAHQGRLEVTSEAGSGSTFRVWLPLEAGSAGRVVK